jgi:hypothetical protein
MAKVEQNAVTNNNYDYGDAETPTPPRRRSSHNGYDVRVAEALAPNRPAAPPIGQVAQQNPAALADRDARPVEGPTPSIVGSTDTIVPSVAAVPTDAEVLIAVRGQLEDIVAEDLKEHFLNDDYLRLKIYGNPPQTFAPGGLESAAWLGRLAELRADIQSTQSNLTRLAQMVQRTYSNYRHWGWPLHFPTVTAESLARGKILDALLIKPSLQRYADPHYQTEQPWIFFETDEDRCTFMLTLVMMAYHDVQRTDRSVYVATFANGYTCLRGNNLLPSGRKHKDTFGSEYWTLRLGDPLIGKKLEDYYDTYRVKVDPQVLLALPEMLDQSHGEELNENPVFDRGARKAIVDRAMMKIAFLRHQLSLLDQEKIKEQLEAAWEECRGYAYHDAAGRYADRAAAGQEAEIITAAQRGYFASDFRQIVEPYLKRRLDKFHAKELRNNPVLGIEGLEETIIHRALMKCVEKNPIYSVPVELGELDRWLEDAWHEVRIETYGRAADEEIEKAGRLGYKPPSPRP